MSYSPRDTPATYDVYYYLIALGTSFLAEPVDTTAIIGQSSMIDCAPPPSTPPANITWSRDLVQLDSPRFLVLENGSLVISAVELSDQGTYRCMATNPVLGTTRTSREAAVTAIGTC